MKSSDVLPSFLVARQYAFGRQRQNADEEGEGSDYSDYDDDDLGDKEFSEEDTEAEESEDESEVVAAMGKINLHDHEQ